MRHKVKSTRLNRKPAQLKALLRSLADSLIINNEITTTKAKAKMLKPFVDKLIARTKKKDNVNAIRYAKRFLLKKESSLILITELLDKYKERTSGFTRTTRLGNRPGDNSEIVKIQLI